MRSPTDRFHALDATRAFALLLGVVFHASWSFTGRPFTAAIVDISGSLGVMWFFFASHMFRMQLFFLIAGFFARLLYLRRGPASFAWNRFERIVVPMIVGWLILSPIRSLVWAWGANVSGSNLSPLSFREIFSRLFVQGQMFIEPSQGGMFSLIHLWFLYYLIWIYILFIAGRFLLLRIVPTGLQLDERANRVVVSIVRSPWSLAWLSVALGLCLWPMTTWFGVNTPTSTYSPQLPPLCTYGVFFMLGWLLHRQACLLADFQRHWKWQLAVGMVLSVVAFLGFGLAAAATRSAYRPALVEAQVTDWPRFLTILKSAATDNTALPELKHFWSRFPGTSQAAILRLSDMPDPNKRDGLCKAITALLMTPDPFGKTAREGESDKKEPASLSLNLLENRKTFDAPFEGVIAPDSRTAAWYWPAKLV